MCFLDHGFRGTVFDPLDVLLWPWLCKNSRRYNRTRNFGLYGHAEVRANFLMIDLSHGAGWQEVCV